MSAIPSKPHTFSARLLLDTIFAQPGVLADVNGLVIVLSVFYFTVLMRNLTFLQLWVALIGFY